MTNKEKIAELVAANKVTGVDRTTKATNVQEIARINFINKPDEAYVAPSSTNYTSSRVKPITTEALAIGPRFDTGKANRKEVVCEFMAPTENSPEGWVSSQGVQGRILTPKQFAKILGRQPKVGDEVVVMAYQIRKGEWYPSAPGSDSYAQEALVDHWLVPSEARVRNVEDVKAELAQSRALAQATAIVESNVDLVKLAQAAAIAANLAKAASYKAAPAGLVMDTEQ